MTLYPQQQQDEVETIQAIYPDEFQLLKAKVTAWQKLPNLMFYVRVPALDNPQIAVVLKFEFPPAYPKLSPKIEIKDMFCNNPKAQGKIDHFIDSMPKDLYPNEVVWPLCEKIQEILSDAARLKAENEGAENLARERAQQRKEALVKADQEHRKKLEQEEEEQVKDAKRVAEIVKDAKQKKAIRRTKSQHDADPTLPKDRVPPTFVFDQSMTTTDVRGSTSVTFQAVFGNSIILKTHLKTVTVVTPYTNDDVLVPQLLLKEIVLPETSSVTATFSNIMQEIESLLENSKAQRHPNVVDLLGFDVSRKQQKDSEVGARWEVTVLSEYANKGSLSDLLDIVDTIDADQVRSWTHQILDALSFFDQHGYVHPALHVGNVLLFRSASGSMTIKLSDGYGTALRDLVLKSRGKINFFICRSTILDRS